MFGELAFSDRGFSAHGAIVSEASSQSFSATQTSTPTLIAIPPAIVTDFNFTKTAAAFVVVEDSATIDANFTQTTAAIYIASGVGSLIGIFNVTSNGELLFAPLDAATSAESWTNITHTGDSWTTITPSGSESYTNIDTS